MVPGHARSSGWCPGRDRRASRRPPSASRGGPGRGASAAPPGRGGGCYFCPVSAARAARRGRGRPRRHIRSRRPAPRRAATMSTAAFHISSLLEKMTSSDKDFRCAPLPAPASPPPIETPAFFASRRAGPSPTSVQPLPLCRVTLHPSRDPRPAAAAPLLLASQPCALYSPCFVSHRARVGPCLGPLGGAPAPPSAPFLCLLSPSVPALISPRS